MEAAERRAADGGTEQLAGRLTQYRADLGLLHELNAIDTFRWTWAGRGYPDRKAVAARWRIVLAGHGVTSDEGRAGEAAGRVSRSLVRDRLLAALDGWLAYEPTDGVRAVLRAADPDPYRDAVRDAVIAWDARAVSALVGRPEALVQPARFAVVLGQFGMVPAEQRRVVLESALRVRPGDLYLLMALGDLYPGGLPEGASEQVRWYQAAVAAHPGNGAAHNNLGNALRAKGDPDGAIAAFREAVRIDPESAAHYNLGLVLQLKGNLGGAIAAYREVIRLKPQDARAHFNLGLALQFKGEPGEAVAAYREAVRIDPKATRAHNNLARLLAAGPDGVRDSEQAVEYATRACELTGWKDPSYIDTLAVAYAEVGSFGKAVEYQKKALSVPAFEKKHGKGGRERLKLYDQKKPFRDPALAPHEVGPPPREVKP